jgi:hypothetical protein
MFDASGNSFVCGNLKLKMQFLENLNHVEFGF